MGVSRNSCGISVAAIGMELCMGEVKPCIASLLRKKTLPEVTLLVALEGRQGICHTEKGENNIRSQKQKRPRQTMIEEYGS